MKSIKTNRQASLTTTKESFPYDEKPLYIIVPDLLRFTLSYKGLRAMTHESLCEEHEEVVKGTIHVDNSFFLKKRYPIKNYKLEYDVVFDEEVVAELLISSRQAFKNHWVKLGMENHTLYSGWYEYYDTIRSKLGLYYNNIEELHIACDGHGLFSKFRHYVLNSDINDGTLYRYIGKAKINALQNNGEFTVGKKKSGKVIASYPKTAEPSYTNGTKPYVRELHLSNGLDPEREIGRVELRVCNHYLRKLNLTPEDLRSPETLSAIFKQGTQSCLKFSEVAIWGFDQNRNKKHKEVSVIDYTAFPTRPLDKAFRKTALPKLSNSQQNIKISFRTLLYNYFSDDSHDNLKQLRAFPNNKLNLLWRKGSSGSHPYAKQESDEEYRRLCKKYTIAYKGSMSAAALSRRNRIDELLFPVCANNALANLPELMPVTFVVSSLNSHHHFYVSEKYKSLVLSS